MFKKNSRNSYSGFPIPKASRQRILNPPSSQKKIPESKIEHCNCGFTKSKLFCTSDNGVVNFDVLPGVDFWQTVATLEICQEDCADVLHDVSGVAATTAFSSPDGAPTIINFDVKFRIIDEVAKEVCQRSFNFSKTVTPNVPSGERVTVDFPFYFKCCDRPRQCESNTTYRLQVSSETTSGNAPLRDVDWTATVWENC